MSKQDTIIRNNLSLHFRRMLELQKKGLTQTEASKQAYNELKEGKLKTRG